MVHTYMFLKAIVRMNVKPDDVKDDDKPDEVKSDVKQCVRPIIIEEDIIE